MITAVDTNVLVDVLFEIEPHWEPSRRWLHDAYERGAVLVCDVVYAELVPSFNDRDELNQALRDVNIAISPINTGIAYEAGRRWMRYRQAGGPRERILADFLIGAHALVVADAFLTRDRGFYATYFPELKGFSSPTGQPLVQYVHAEQPAAGEARIELVERVFLLQDARENRPLLVRVADRRGAHVQVALHALLQVVRELRVGEQVRRPVARPRVVRQVDLAVETAQTHLLPVRVSGLAAGRRDVDQPIVIERVANVGVQWMAS